MAPHLSNEARANAAPMVYCVGKKLDGWKMGWLAGILIVETFLLPLNDGIQIVTYVEGRPRTVEIGTEALGRKVPRGIECSTGRSLPFEIRLESDR